MSLKSPAGSAGVKNRCVALDLGAASVRAVEIEWLSADRNPVSARIVRKGAAALPRGCWADIDTHRDGMSSAIREALASGGISAGAVVACMPRRLVTLRFVKMPNATPAQMRGMVTFEAQQHVLFPLDEVMLDYHVLPDPLGAGELRKGEELQTILLAATRKSFIANLLSVFDKAGLELQQLSISALALAEHLRDSLEPVIILDVEPGEMDVAAVADGRLIFTRSSSLDLHDTPTAGAERRLAEEVVRSFTAYQNEFRNRPLSHVYLAGASFGGLDPSQVESALSRVLDLPVTRWHSRLLPQNEEDLLPYATAIGMALQTSQNSIAPINLVPSERIERKANLQKTQRKQFALLAVVILFVVGVVYLQKALKEASIRDRDTRTANDQLKTVTDLLAVRQKSHDTISAFEKELELGLNRKHPAIDVLAALSSSLPGSVDIWLTQFTFERGGQLTLRGETKKASSATDMVLALQASGAFSEARLSYLGDAQDVPALGSSSTPKAAGSGRTTPVTRAAVPPLPGFNTNNASPPTSPSAAPGAKPGSAPGAIPSMAPGGGLPGAGGFPGGSFPGASMDGGGFPGGFTPPPPPPPGNPQIQPKIRYIPKSPSPIKAAKKTAKREGTGSDSTEVLTSFVITCRINPNAVTLLPPKGLKVKPFETKKKVDKKAPFPAASSDAGSTIEED